MSLYTGGLIIGRIFASEIWGAYFREGLFFLGGGEGGLLSEFYGSVVWTKDARNPRDVAPFQKVSSGWNFSRCFWFPPYLGVAVQCLFGDVCCVLQESVIYPVPFHFQYYIGEAGVLFSTVLHLV